MMIPEYDIAAHTEQARHDRNMHHHPSGYVRPADLSRGRCTWRWDSFGVLILCWSYDMPGTGFCPHHAAQQPETVVFPSVVVKVAGA